MLVSQIKRNAEQENDNLNSDNVLVFEDNDGTYIRNIFLKRVSLIIYYFVNTLDSSNSDLDDAVNKSSSDDEWEEGEEDDEKEGAENMELDEDDDDDDDDEEM